jgi:hypothetical protein
MNDYRAPGGKVPTGSIQVEVNRLRKELADTTAQVTRLSDIINVCLARERALVSALRDITAPALRASKLLDDA